MVEDKNMSLVEERIAFLEFIKRKLIGEVQAEKIVYFADEDYHEDLDKDLKYHTDLIDKWIKDFDILIKLYNEVAKD